LTHLTLRAQIFGTICRIYIFWDITPKKSCQTWLSVVISNFQKNRDVVNVFFSFQIQIFWKIWMTFLENLKKNRIAWPTNFFLPPTNLFRLGTSNEVVLDWFPGAYPCQLECNRNSIWILPRSIWDTKPEKFDPRFLQYQWTWHPNFFCARQ